MDLGLADLAPVDLGLAPVDLAPVDLGRWTEAMILFYFYFVLSALFYSYFGVLFYSYFFLKINIFEHSRDSNSFFS